ncbi:MAG: class I SAM-dependent methyltransferase [Dehalococcoidia bacterium]
MKKVRAHTVNSARGRVLEIGAGTGTNFPYYHRCDHLQVVIATDPDPHMVKRAERRLHRLGLDKVDLRQALAEELPFDDCTFDTVISVLVLCTVQDLDRSLREIRRVLKPSGQFRFYEHVRSTNRLEAFTQDVMTPVWKWLGAGCHPNRDIPPAIEKAGFRIAELRRLAPFLPIPFLAPTRPHILGVAYPA